MPRLTEKIDGTSFIFSAVRPEDLDATKYTLVTIVLDKTGSVSPFASDLLNMLQTTVEACKKNPMSENLLVRVTEFNERVNEVHGFKLLSTIDKYEKPVCCGCTALYDASLEAIGATLQYAKTLSANDYTINSCIYIITDGMDNASRSTVNEVKQRLQKLVADEECGSIVTILVGINDSDCASYLSSFQANAGINQFVSMGEVTPGKLAKLGGMISKSISSQSQSLQTGVPAASLTF